MYSAPSPYGEDTIAPKEMKMSSPVARTHKWIKVNPRPKVKGVFKKNQRAPKKMKEDTLYQHNNKGVIQRLVDRAIREGSKEKNNISFKCSGIYVLICMPYLIFI